MMILDRLTAVMPPYNPRENIMIDIESLDVSPGGVVLSIGACSFDLAKLFYVQISIEDSMKHKFNVNVKTQQWWSQQPASVRNEAFSGVVPVMGALISLTAFLNDIKKVDADHTLNIWGNGADFDVPMLNAVFDKLSMQRPWGHRDSRCFRTLKNLFSGVEEPVFSGEKHNALADAMHQARWADAIFTALHGSWHGLNKEVTDANE